jgi:hypothetical protein
MFPRKVTPSVETWSEYEIFLNFVTGPSGKYGFKLDSVFRITHSASVNGELKSDSDVQTSPKKYLSGVSFPPPTNFQNILIENYLTLTNAQNNTDNLS